VRLADKRRLTARRRRAGPRVGSPIRKSRLRRSARPRIGSNRAPIREGNVRCRVANMPRAAGFHIMGAIGMSE
jgi:hypothetical protein